MCTMKRGNGDDDDDNGGAAAADKTPLPPVNDNNDKNRPANPLERASFLSRLLFLWPFPLLQLGMTRPLCDDDLAAVAAVDSSQYNLHFFTELWNAECRRCPERPSLHRAILTSFLKRTWFVQPLMCAAATAKVVQAVALGNLIEYFEGNDDRGFLWATLLVACAVVVLFEHHHVFLYTWRTGMQYRTACVAAVYDKSLRLSSTHQDTAGSYGRIMNLASNDVERFLLASLFVSHLFWAPVQSLAILAVGVWLLGPAFAAGFALLVAVLVPLQSYLSRRFAHYRSKVAAITDERVTFVSQAVRGARVMKMSGYENRFLDRIAAVRAAEVSQIRKANRLKSANEAVFFATNAVVSVVVFVVHVAAGGTLSAGVVFTVFTLINVLQIEMAKHVSLGIMGVSECYVSVSRIQNFLEFPEIDVPDASVVRQQQRRQQNHHDDNNEGCSKQQQQLQQSSSATGTGCGGISGGSISGSGCSDRTTPSSIAREEGGEAEEGGDKQPLPLLSFRNVTCYWDDVKKIISRKQEELTAKEEDDDDDGENHYDSDDDDDEENTQGRRIIRKQNKNKNGSRENMFLALDRVSVDFCPGEITAVIGAVGSGKSALLQAVVRELPCRSGAVHRRYDSLSYAAQDPWIMDGTVRDNILLGRPWDAAWYNAVVDACCLRHDMLRWKRGDETVVGDRGVQCSGGQRARIGLARAVYRDADVLVADDPLSAVDAAVGKQLYERALLGLAAGRGKAVVLATHQHQYIRDCRRVVLLVSGTIPAVGTYEECVSASAGRLTAHAAHDNGAVDNLVQDNDDNDNDALDESVQDKSTKKKKVPVIDDDKTANGDNDNDKKDNDSSETDNDEDEMKELNVQGLVKRDTYISYCRAMGGIWVGLFLFALYCVTQASVLVTIAYTGKWAELPAAQQRDAKIQGTVAALAAAVAALGLFRAAISFLFAIRASQKLHDGMTAAVLRSKIEFFDTNPTGRVMNRFSADVGSNDDLLPHTLYDFCTILFIVVGAVATTVVTLPYTLLAIPPLLWYFVRVRTIFVTSTRELKRLEGLARSPIFAMLSESLSGVATIRSNAAAPYFRAKFRQLHDAHTRAFFGFISASRWVGFRMDGLMFLFLTLASYLSVVFHQRGWFDVDPAILGLALSMLLQLAGLFQWCIRQSAEVVNQMVSVERVLAFGKLPAEAALELPGDKQDRLSRESWPARGAIDVRDLSVRYRSSLPLALNHVSFTIPAGSRVGVVGRTGSGKSTVVQTLFRLLEAESGRIVIDGVDIAAVGLHTLRTRISVIPQVPTLFSGCTVRENLDLFNLHSDDSLRRVLADCHLSDVIADLPSGWDSLVSEGGSNFSVGQRQLLCLARAVLCKNKILVLDEATASIDRRTDQLLQEALKASFRDGTILAVAHRLDTVIESDYVLVLGQGRVLEFGSPADLLQNSGDGDSTAGAFASMVRDTGETMANELKQRALQQRRRRQQQRQQESTSETSATSATSATSIYNGGWNVISN